MHTTSQTAHHSCSPMKIILLSRPSLLFFLFFVWKSEMTHTTQVIWSATTKKPKHLKTNHSRYCWLFNNKKKYCRIKKCVVACGFHYLLPPFSNLNRFSWGSTPRSAISVSTLCSNNILLSGGRPRHALKMLSMQARCLKSAFTTGVPGGTNGALHK